MKNKFIFLVLLLGCMVGCKTQHELLLASTDIDEKYAKAFEYFNLKKYKKAASVFESLSFQTSGMDMDDTVRYYWALSNYKSQDYITAEANFSSFVELYSRSPFTEDSRFLLLDCTYRNTYRWELDQQPTKQAIYDITDYMLAYPDSPNLPVVKLMLDELQDRLDRKEFENARLYYKMEDYIAAKTSLKTVIKDNAENRYREEVLYYLTMSCYRYAQLSVVEKQKDRYMEFVDNYYNFIAEFPESRFRSDLDVLYARYQRSTGIIKASREELKADKKADKKAERMVRKEEQKINREKEAAEKQRKESLK